MNRLKSPTWNLLQAPRGPLNHHLDGFYHHLHKQGFCRHYIGTHIRHISRFSSWLADNNITINNISEHHAIQFIKAQNKQKTIRRVGPNSVQKILAYLDQIEVSYLKKTPVAPTKINIAMKAFEDYLLNYRELSPKTFSQYAPTIKSFLSFKFGGNTVDYNLIIGSDIIRFVQVEVKNLSATRGKVVVNAMRAFLRYGMHRFQLSPNLLSVVPKVASWSQPGIIKAISTAEIDKLLLSCNRSTIMGVRDFAVLLLLARLGLRAAEITSLSLDAINWESGTLSFIGKSKKHACLPLPEDVAEALAKYLRQRPIVSTRLIFIRTVAPFTPLVSPQSVISIVNSAVKRAGICPPTKGTHQFRYGLATSMLKHGANLVEIASILRHEQIKTTNLYAKVDIESLRSLSPVWLGGSL